MATAFFLETTTGRRFCVFYESEREAGQGTQHGLQCRGAVLLVAPFGEEMNKSRRMLALQARALTRQGFAVLLMDLYGCGDSDGELRDASWDRWKADLTQACAWLSARTQAPLSLLGVRLGALLALDFLRDQSYPIRQIVLWQPVLNGQQFLTQFFRLRLAGEMMAGKSALSGGMKAIRQALLQGEIVEIAGYEISAQLAHGIEALDAEFWEFPRCRMDWLETLSSPDSEFAPARMRIAELWKNQGQYLALTKMIGPEFWASQEIGINSELIDNTAQIFALDTKQIDPDELR